MLIPKSLLSVYDRGQALEIMREELRNKHWTREDIFKVFLQTRKWEAFKRHVVEDIVHHKPFVKRTSLSDVPDYIKAENPNYYSYLLKSNKIRTQHTAKKSSKVRAR